MDKLLVEVFVPASGQTYDVFIPLKSKLHEVLQLLTGTVTELSQGYFIAKEDTILCNRVTGEVLNINETIEGIGLKHGSKLMLI